MPKERSLALDRFRGLAIILMLIVNDLDSVLGVPDIVKHAPDRGYHVADVVAPLFIFAIALTFRPSFMRRAAEDKGKTYAHFATRYLAIIGIGTILTALGNTAGQISEHWAALQSIGVAGLLTLLVIQLPAWARAVISLGGLGIYEVLNQGPIRDMVFGEAHGGFLGSFSWAAMLILCTVMAELFAKGMKYFLPAAAALAGAGAALALTDLVPISKNRVSASYVLLSIAMCCAAYLLVDLFTKKLPGVKKGVTAWWGENPMLFYILHSVFQGITRIPCIIAGIDERPLWIGILDVVFIFAVMSFIAWKLDKKGKKISL